jgi:S-ribosylhomocysteine lyase LuxS involved in autoinducer biosynthesis
MDFESNDRRVVDYVLFALGFRGFMLGMSGVILASPAGAVTGFFMLLFSLLCYSVAQPDEA